MAEAGAPLLPERSPEPPIYDAALFPAFRSSTLDRFGHEALDEYDPIKYIAHVAFKHRPRITQPRAKEMIEDIGKQFDSPVEDVVTPQMASFLRRATGEGVYSYRIANGDAWRIAAEAISDRTIGSGTACVLLHFAGVSTKVISNTFYPTLPRLLATTTAHLLGQVHAKPEKVTTLSKLIQSTLRPLRLWPLSAETADANSTSLMMRGIFEGITIDSGSDIVVSESSLEKQIAVLDALSIRYLTRPTGGREALPDPHRSIDMLRQRCTMTACTLAEIYNLNPSAPFVVLRNIRKSLRAGLSGQDMKPIKDFLVDATPTLTLPPLPLPTYKVPS